MGVASRNIMTTPAHQARLDAARKPPFEMEGAPTTHQITSPVAGTVEQYANGETKTVADDGDITYSYQGRDVKQYSQYFGTRDGMVMTYFTNGSREQVMPNGAILEAANDGSMLQTNPNGLSVASRPNGYKLQTNPNGTTVETHPDTALVDGDFPACKLPCGSPMSWQQIKTVQTGLSSKHFITADGSDIQQDSDKSILANFKPGHCQEADDHYGDKPWALSISPDGSLVQYLIKEGVDTHADGSQATAWIVDVWWKEQEAIREAAKIKTEQERLTKQKEDDDKKTAARDMLTDPNASSGDLQKMANDMDGIGDDEAKGLSKELCYKAKAKKMEEDLKRVWEEQADDKMKSIRKCSTPVTTLQPTLEIHARQLRRQPRWQQPPGPSTVAPKQMNSIHLPAIWLQRLLILRSLTQPKLPLWRSVRNSVKCWTMPKRNTCQRTTSQPLRRLRHLLPYLQAIRSVPRSGVMQSNLCHC